MQQHGVISGGCQCGEVRYRVRGAITEVHLCHCRMCQKAVGNAFATIGVAQRRDLAFVHGEAAWFRSSDNVFRGFCRLCGTPLFYADRTSDSIGIMIGTIDDPRPFPPERQDGIERRLDWVLALSRLPGMETGGADGDEGRTSAIAQSNRQFPDFGDQA